MWWINSQDATAQANIIKVVMQDYCQVMRDEFKLLNRHNPEQLSNFFFRYKFFSTNDLAQVLSLSSRYIRMLKNRTDGTGIVRTHSRAPRPTPNIHVVPDIKLEPGWDCAAWWRHYYALYGTRVLSKITHLSREVIRGRLRRYNIPIRQLKGFNPHCSYAWLYKHYVEFNWGLVRCANAAGVTPDTITSWLNTFKIQVKTRNAPKFRNNTSKMGKVSGDSTAVGEIACVTVGAD